jgi:hypothetical protein
VTAIDTPDTSIPNPVASGAEDTSICGYLSIVIRYRSKPTKPPTAEACHDNFLRVEKKIDLWAMPVRASLPTMGPSILPACAVASDKIKFHGLCPNKGLIACHRHKKLRTCSASRLMGGASSSVWILLDMPLLTATDSLLGLQEKTLERDWLLLAFEMPLILKSILGTLPAWDSSLRYGR